MRDPPDVSYRPWAAHSAKSLDGPHGPIDTGYGLIQFVELLGSQVLMALEHDGGNGETLTSRIDPLVAPGYQSRGGDEILLNPETNCKLITVNL